MASQMRWSTFKSPHRAIAKRNGLAQLPFHGYKNRIKSQHVVWWSRFGGWIHRTGCSEVIHEAIENRSRNRYPLFSLIKDSPALY